MYIQTTTLLALLTSLTAAQDDPNPYIKPSSTDTRSACPGLNILANHGYINRNGTDITKESAIQAQMLAFNFDRETAAGPIDAVLRYSTTSTPAISFNLLDISRPPLDQNGKKTRTDRFFGDPVPFNRTVWDSVIESLPDGDNTFTWTEMADAGAQRQARAKAENPEYELSATHVASTFAQITGLIAVFGGSVEDGMARIDWLNASIVEEKLPYHLGWKKSEEVLGTPQLGPILVGLRTAQPGGV
ncbi:hypothetical protein HYFRA_00011085 [Hymenoscyphus fraxineus]|uniref:Heme haloperoxidase family profile domain-containing protein n=1 Tax=Hymenoscyphus fraxineus TaxID=746836 RepID=A0A9N9L5C9_9HELO|nr:hypothetical protein HYFRA_00011085 [Hymenoscyphus fraxineus]